MKDLSDLINSILKDINANKELDYKKILAEAVGPRMPGSMIDEMSRALHSVTSVLMGQHNKGGVTINTGPVMTDQEMIIAYAAVEPENLSDVCTYVVRVPRPGCGDDNKNESMNMSDMKHRHFTYGLEQFSQFTKGNKSAFSDPELSQFLTGFIPNYLEVNKHEISEAVSVVASYGVAMCLCVFSQPKKDTLLLIPVGTFPPREWLDDDEGVK